MPFDAQVLQVLIASPGDTRPYRDAVEQALYDWNRNHGASTGTMYLPRRWEFDTVPMFGLDAQAVVNEQIVDAADLVIGLFWHRIGLTTARATSGSVEEIERCREAGKSVHLFFGTMDVPHTVEIDQLQRLREYQGKVNAQGLMGQYASDADLIAHVRRVLDYHASSGHRPPAPRTSVPPNSARSQSSTRSPEVSDSSAARSEDVRVEDPPADVKTAASPVHAPLRVQLLNRRLLRVSVEPRSEVAVVYIHDVQISRNGLVVSHSVSEEDTAVRVGAVHDVKLPNAPLQAKFGVITMRIRWALTASSTKLSSTTFQFRDTSAAG